MNNCLRMHCLKWITNTKDTVKIEKRFPSAKEQRKAGILENLSKSMCMAV